MTLDERLAEIGAAIIGDDHARLRGSAAVLLSAVEAVLAEHKPEPIVSVVADFWCTADRCGAWPCSTVLAIGSALGVSRRDRHVG